MNRDVQEGARLMRSITDPPGAWQQVQEWKKEREPDLSPLAQIATALFLAWLEYRKKKRGDV
jgi:hypothetical protein